jgi:DNA helicase-4
VLRESDDAPVQLEGEARKREITRLVNALHGEHDEFTEQYDAFRDAYRDEEFDVELTEQRELVTEHRDRDDVLVTGEDIETTNPLIREAHNNIAEWLLVNDVPFEYQAFTEWAGEVGDGDAYTPDFTLCEHDIRIEYLPETSTDGDDEVIDHRAVENGSDDEEWLSAVEIARIHDDHEKTVIPIDREAVTSGAYREKLRSELREHGVDVTDGVDSIDDVENLGDVVQPAYEAITMERTVEELFGDFIKKAKTNQINAYERMQNAFSSDGESGGESEYDDVFVAFNRAAVILLEAYKQRYDAVNAFDFVDMITEATEEINAGRVSDAVDYKHVIVDEFQDLNLTQIEFIQAVLDYGRETRLFAVGDDWQSIYGFKGARPDYFVNFEEHFAPATQTRLVENYRCPENVVETGNTLIRNNESRTEKTVTAFKDITMEPVVHRVPGSRAVQYENNAVQRARDVIVESVSDDGRDPGDVMVLVRNRAGSRIPGLLRDALGKAGIPVSGDDGVEITTAHGAKGGEAKHVVVMNAAQGRFDGFPAMERERELTSLVSVSSGSHLDEERRLFYVAVTRAEERLDIQTKTGSESRFVHEIAAHVDERTHGVDVSRDRVTTAVTVVKTKESEPHWSTKQLGRVETPDGVMMDYAIPDAAGTDRFCEGTAYKVQDVLIDEYEGEPQLVFDEQASVVEMSASV